MINYYQKHVKNVNQLKQTEVDDEKLRKDGDRLRGKQGNKRPRGNAGEEEAGEGNAENAPGREAEKQEQVDENYGKNNK